MKCMTGLMKFGALTMIAIIPLLFIALNVIPVLAAHTSTAELEPEWSVPGVTNDYTVTITNDGPDTVDEVRIYKNELYGGFEDSSACEEKTGWELNFIGSRKACHYIAISPAYYIEANQSEDFEFHATAPSEDPEECLLQWKFETRDVNEVWKTIYDTTSIDSEAPVTTKTYGTPFYTDGTYDWIGVGTPITLTAVDMSEDCGIGVDKTYYRYCLDSGCYEDQPCECIDTPWIEYDGDPFSIPDDSEHCIEFYSYDLLENTEDVNSQCVYVDDTIPVVTKDVGGPNIHVGEGFDYWVTQNTPIYFGCYDQEPHPSDDVTIHWSYTVDGQGPITGNHHGDQYTFYFQEDSVHILDLWCVDAVGKESDHDIETFKVDTEPPAITKTMIGTDHLGDCPPTEPDDECYVRDNGENGVNITVIDPDPTGYGCAVDDVYCEWELWWEATPMECELGNGYDYDDGWCLIGDDEFSTDDEVIFTHDSQHMLIIDCEDDLGNYVEDVEYFKVDSTPPVTEKTYGEPQKVDPLCAEIFCAYNPECMHDICTWWITSGTEVTLTAEDEKVGNVYGNTIYWRNLYFPDNPEICYRPSPTLLGSPTTTQIELDECHPEYYMQYVNETPAWNVYDGPFTKPEESCHVIEYYSVDALGNEEPLNWQCVFVDNTAPVGIKTIGDPQMECDGGEIDMPVVVDAFTAAALPERTGDVYVAPETPVTISNGDPCSGVSQGATQCAYVDAASAPPFVKDTMAAQGAVPNESCGGILILSSGLPLDSDTYLSTSMGNPGCGTNPDGYPTYDCVILPGYTPSADSIVLAISSEWAEYLYSSFTDWMEIGGMVDVSINDWVGDPSLVELGAYGPQASGTVTLAVLAASQSADLRVADSGDHVLDTAMIVVPVSCFAEEPEPILCGNGIVEPGEECDDGNNDNGDGCSAICLLEGEPEPEPPECTWVRDHVTEITLDCVDQEPHPVEQETVCYKVSFDDPDTPWLTEDYCEEFGGDYEDGWCCAYVGDEPYTFTFQEDSVHDLEFYCMDHLGNTEAETDFEYFKVDSIAPVTTKTYVGPFYEEDGLEWIDTATVVQLEAEDGGPVCAVGVDTIEYRVSGAIADSFCENCENWMKLLRPDMGPWNTYIEPFGIAEESCHVIEYRSIDLLGNTEEIKWQCAFVDKTPPVIEKWYVGPYFEEEGVEWITSDTIVAMDAYDPDPHPSGMKELKYRITLLQDDQACIDEIECQLGAEGSGDWTMHDDDAEVHIGEESCHLIEIMATDNVDKSSLHKQCVFVDNTEPYPNKTVGEPKTPWDGLDANFYDLDQFCQEPGKCWKTTLLTPLYLECIDPEPHPVDHEIVCIKVELDAQDKTEDYCDWYGGEMEDDGYCCLEHEIEEFYFNEVSEHNLAYYCVDALGNSNRDNVDDEKFKVEETAFEIQLNMKWNLISVPVRLLDDSMNEVFKDVADTVDTVWTYDGVADQWYVYTPDGDDSNDNLHTMLPGWGYWVLSLDDDLLVIGGSLMSPAMLPPSKGIAAGWNLIGYYGADGEKGYYGPVGNGAEANCALNSLGISMWDKGFTSLWTYWEPDNPDLWKPLDKDSNMDPGAGYWLLAQEDGLYAPSTTCNFDL